MAERQGFEPWGRLPAHTLSKRAHSTTLPPLHQTETINIVRLRSRTTYTTNQQALLILVDFAALFFQSFQKR